MDSEVELTPLGRERVLFSTETKKRRSHLSAYDGPQTATQSTSADSEWADLVSKSQKMMPYISSVDGLQQTFEFQKHIREEHNLFHVERVQGKIDTYKDLRRMDPVGFRKLWTRTDIRDYSVQDAPTWMLLLDYVMSLATTAGVVLWPLFKQDGEYLRWLPAIAWLLLQLMAWACGNSSVYGRVLGMYFVSGEEEEQQTMVGGVRVVLTQLLEFLYLAATCGLGILTSTFLMCVPHRRGPFSQQLLGMRLVHETSRPVQMARFPPLTKTYPAVRRSSPVSLSL